MLTLANLIACSAPYAEASSCDSDSPHANCRTTTHAQVVKADTSTCVYLVRHRLHRLAHRVALHALERWSKTIRKRQDSNLRPFRDEISNLTP